MESFVGARVLTFAAVLLFGLGGLSFPVDGQVATGTMSAGTGSGSRGALVSIPIQVSASSAIGGFSFGLTQDANRLTVETAVLGASLDPLQGGVDPDFEAISVNPGGSAGVTYGIVIDFFAAVQLPAGVVHTVGTVTYRVATLAPAGATPLDFTEALAAPPSPPVEVFIVIGVEEIAPTLSSGAVTVVMPQFIRGDVNLSGSVNLTDAVNLLYRVFGVEPQGTCMDADDVDGSGNVNIGDPLAILFYLFTSGSPPTAPFPACGAPPISMLGCLSSPCP